MTSNGTTFSGLDLLVSVGSTSGLAKRSQLAEALRRAIRDERLGPGTRLPSSRSLAGDLAVSRGVVVDAYDQLTAEGYLVARQGSGTVVAPRAHVPMTVEVDSPVAPSLRFDFRPGLPDLATFPRGPVLAAMRRVLRSVPDSALGYGNPSGAMDLRIALASYLARVRGVVADPNRIVVCTGYAQGLSLALRVLWARGHRRVAVEDPGSPEPRDFVAHTGVEVVPVKVDAAGIRVDELDRSGASVVLVTPAHQFPTGVVLSASRRHDLLAWAREGDRLVIEDDYDAEYRYDRQPVGALHGLAPEHVIYAGTTSKTLAPALRLGWLVAPRGLRDDLVETKRYDDLHSSALDQLALAEMIDSGVFDRHIRRTRAGYRRRRDRLVEALTPLMPAVGICGVAAGMHAIVTLPTGTDEAAVVAVAADRSLGLYGLDRYRSELSDRDPALVVGYTTCPEHSYDEGLRTLIQLLGALPLER